MIAIHTKFERDAASGAWLYHHRMTAKADGYVLPTHRHTYDHTTRCHAGRVTFWSEDGGSIVMSPGDERIVPAGVAHDVEFHEAGSVVECVHELRDEHGEKVPFSYELTPRDGLRLTGLL